MELAANLQKTIETALLVYQIELPDDPDNAPQIVAVHNAYVDVLAPGAWDMIEQTRADGWRIALREESSTIVQAEGETLQVAAAVFATTVEARRERVVRALDGGVSR